ncbi:hypothetical protein BGZ60DRAFT_515816 [Tricladium varicosporioides]|nr:hypothetical protein BGZ60DRAFT_515816 [Hymenoscyphus varicosporioides]
MDLTYLSTPTIYSEESDPKVPSLASQPPPPPSSVSISSPALDSPPSPTSSQNGNSGNEKKKETIITVGVSGCSSSGKTTLAFLLNEIFNPLAHPRLTPGTIVKQDAFFFPKANLPSRHFSCYPLSPIERAFLEMSLAEYQAEKGDRKQSMPGLPDDNRSLYGIEREGNGEGFGVRGPDSDCAAAVDFRRLVESLKGEMGKTGGESAEVDVDETGKCTGGTMPGECSHSRKHTPNPPSALVVIEGGEEKARCKYRDLIYEQRLRVRELLRRGNLTSSQNGAESPPFRFIFLEGFLLFTPPPHSPLQFILTRGEQGSPLGVRCSACMRDWRQELMSLIEIPLFLPTSREAAKARRFSRNIYRDAHLGGRRLPGQMWKSEGYFEEVVWQGYRKEFGWLIDTDGDGRGEDSRMGVWVRGKEDAGVEESVEWAVSVILEGLDGRL